MSQLTKHSKDPMPQIFTLSQIEAVLPHIDIVAEVAAGFVAYSEGKVEVPPVGELLFPRNNGEMHIKYGAIRGDDVFVVKLATGFFDNPARGLAPFGGCMLVISQITGQIEGILLEEGVLTNHRTAAAGAVAAQCLLPDMVTGIGIVGTGVQARLQAHYLKRVTECRKIVLWGRNGKSRVRAALDLEQDGFTVQQSGSLEELCATCQLIVTATPSRSPLLHADMIRPGAHITAMGSDTPEKQELSTELLAKANVVVTDSREQAASRGEVSHALQNKTIEIEGVVELGELVGGVRSGRQSTSDISIADLTGVAVQDIAIAKAVVRHLG